jgi:hypothetical protein
MHRLGRNRGTIVSRLQDDRILVGCRCSGCGKITDWQPSPINVPRSSLEPNGTQGEKPSAPASASDAAA